MKVFVINMARDVKRRADMESQWPLRQTDYQFFPGADGKKFTRAELENIADIQGLEEKFRKPIDELRGLIGCTYSHFLIYEKMVKEQIEVACVLEDDVILSKHFPEQLEKLEGLVRPSEVISLHTLLYSDVDFSSTDRQVNGSVICDPSPPKIRGTQGYVIGLDAAKAIADFMVPIIDFPDCFNRYQSWIDDLKVSVLFPFPMRHMWIDSVRDDNRAGWKNDLIGFIQHHRVFPFWNSIRTRRRKINDEYISNFLTMDGKEIDSLYVEDLSEDKFFGRL